MPRVGIIGLGGMGRTHFDVYRNIADAKIVALADADSKRASEALPDARDASRVSDFHELLAMKDLDIVDVCVPTMQHVEVVTAALAAGKHVICEKPLARTIDEGMKIAAAVSAANTFFMPAMCMRFWPEWAWLKRAIDEK